MKKWFVLTLSCLMFHLVSGQSNEHPKREFVFMAESYQVAMSRADTAHLALLIVRSKSFQRSGAALTLASTLPEGMQIQFAPTKGLTDKATVTFIVNEQVPEGEYALLLNCTMQHKTKGIVIKLKVTGS